MLRTEATKVWNMGVDWEPSIIETSDDDASANLQDDKSKFELRYPIFEIGRMMEAARQDILGKKAEAESGIKYLEL